MFSPNDPLLEPLGFERERPSGRFAPAETQPDRSVPPDRGPDGRFVSPDRVRIDNMSRDPLGVYNENPPGPGREQSSGKEFFREIDGERRPASVALEEGPRENEILPDSVSPTDFEQPAEPEGQIMGHIPSAQRLPADARDGLAVGPEADLAFVGAEEERVHEGRNGGLTTLFDF